VKDQPILVITGNPPYSGHSRNMGPVARASIGAYKTVDGKPLGERNPKWLQDDYVKFIRFAQMKMDAVPEGVVGIITNHSYLSNPTFRGMRQSLMGTFDQIFILDLHGSTKPKKTPPDGQIDQNVFEIQKGVAITLFVKRPGAERGVWYGEMWGHQIDKYKALSALEFGKQDWAELEPISPQYRFVPQASPLSGETDPSSGRDRVAAMPALARFSVMAGLVPAIHVLERAVTQIVDARHKAGHDEDRSKTTMGRWLLDARLRGHDKNRERRGGGRREEPARNAYLVAWATRLVTGSICMRASMRFRSFWKSASMRPLS